MEYKITKVSEDTPKEWGEGELKTYYIKVMLEGHDKPVTIGKKKPDALSVGMTVNGNIIPTEFNEDKFKPTSTFGGGSRGKSPEEQDMIIRQSALKSAVAYYTVDKSGEIEDIADRMLLWLKGGSKPQSGYEAAKATAESLKPEPKKEEEPSFDDDEVNLDDIPF